MHDALQSLFSERRAPRHCCRRRVHDSAGPVGALAADMQRQIAEYRSLLLSAEFTDMPEQFRGKLEAMDQTLRAAERIQAELVAAVRGASQIMGQIDAVWDDAEREIAAWESARERERTVG